MNDTFDEETFDTEDRAVLAHLAFDEVAPPPGAEGRLLAAAQKRRAPVAAPVTDLGDERAKRRSRVRASVLAVAGVAAVIVLAVLMTGRDTSTSDLDANAQVVAQSRAAAPTLVAEPGSRHAVLVNSQGERQGQIVIAADGAGAVYDLTAKGPVHVVLETTGGESSLGPAPPAAGVVAFTVDPPSAVRGVRVVDDDGNVLGHASI